MTKVEFSEKIMLEQRHQIMMRLTNRYDPGRDIQLTIGIAGSTHPMPATT